MASYKYIVIANSNASLIKRFRVIMTGYRKILKKAGQVEKTIVGAIDASVGSITQQHEYQIKVRHTEPETDYGTLADLETFFTLNNPNATPSNVLTLTDHYGVAHSCLFWGDFSTQSLGTMIEGNTAWFIGPCSFIFI